MKLTLVSVSVHGQLFSGFLMLDAQSPKIPEKEITRLIGIELPRGTTISVG